MLQKSLLQFEDAQRTEKNNVNSQISQLTQTYLTNQKLTLSYFTKQYLLNYEKQDQKDENARVECERLLIEAQGYF